MLVAWIDGHDRFGTAVSSTLMTLTARRHFLIEPDTTLTYCRMNFLMSGR